MSYNIGLGSSQPEEWDRVRAEADEVYVWRAVFGGAPLDSRDQIRLIAQVVGECLIDKASFYVSVYPDIRAAIYRELGGNSYSITILCTVKQNLLPPGFPSAYELSECVGERLSLARFDLSWIESSEWLQYTDSEAGLPYTRAWLALPIIWDSSLGTEGKGGPTSAWERYEGLYVATDENGAKGDPMRIKPFPGTPSSGIGPGPGGGDPPGPGIGPGPGGGSAEQPQASRWPWVLGAVAIIGGAYLLARRERSGSR